MRRIWQGAAVGTVLVMAWLGARYLAPVDGEEWLQEFAALRRHMTRHYANLDWMVSHRKLDLKALTRTTEARLQGAVVRFQAEGALRDWACPGSVDGYGLGFQALCCNCLLS